LSRKKILHFRIWSGPPISVSVEHLLRDSFPEHDLELITLWDRIKADKKLVRQNLLAVIKEYGIDILLRKLKFKAAFFRTVFLFDQVRQLVEGLGYQNEEVVFTFQLQSIFDTHIEGLPNFVYTDHTHLANLQYSPDTKVNLYSAEWISREKSIYDHAERIFTRSSNISRSLVDQYGIPEEKVKCIYAGSNTRLDAMDPKSKDYSQKSILFVGLDWQRKGGPELLEAFDRVRQNYPDATLTIVGSRIKGNHPGMLSLGHLPVEQLNRYFQNATIFCMPSRNEPFGIVFVEAMAHALPIVATKIGALPDMVADGENGYLILPGDVDGLANALEKLLSDEEKRRQFGWCSWQKSLNLYNWQSVGVLLQSFINDAM
jgi:hypothetical protein